MMEPTACELHAGCLGNVNATWTFRGRSGHSARPWMADNAIEHAAAGVLALAAQPPVPHAFDGLEFVEVATRHADRGRDREQRHPRPRRVPRQLPLRARAQRGRGGGAAGRAVRRPRRAADRLERAVRPGRRRARASTRSSPPATWSARPKQAWTPVAEFGLAGLPAVNFGPGEPAQAHRRDESVEIAMLVRAHDVLERFAA